jgi:hypothetical protein
MHITSVPLEVSKNFQAYILTGPADSFSSAVHLADYAYAWIAYDHGAQACGNDFGIFMSMLMVTEARYQLAPNMYTRNETPDNPPRGLLDLDCVDCCRVIDPQFFQLMVADPDWINRERAENEAQDQEAEESRLSYGG